MSLDLRLKGKRGSVGAGRREAIPPQRALSPPEVCECVRHWDGGGGALGCGQGNGTANGPEVQNVSNKQGDLCNHVGFCFTYYLLTY